MANPAGEIGQLREEELPVVRVVVRPTVAAGCSRMTWIPATWYSTAS